MYTQKNIYLVFVAFFVYRAAIRCVVVWFV